jgi:hypothetical protein
MKNIDFEKLISVQWFDSWTAEILWQYYIKWKWIDIWMWFFLIVFVLFFMSLINHR